MMCDHNLPESRGTQRYCADPYAIVHDGRMYVYCSSDEDNTRGYGGLQNDTLISSDDIVNWTDHGCDCHSLS
jgi:arabinoxylan arabinofuranohydrolase